MENVENYTKEIPKMCKIPHFPHFNEIYSPLDVPLTPSGGLSCLCLMVVVLATPKENVFCKSSITHHDFAHGILQKKLSLLSKQASLVIVIGFIIL